jgi:MFS family permease
LLSRQLDRYPDRAARLSYLGIVVLIAVVLYYVYWEEGATLPLLLPYYHMSFRYFLLLVVISNGLGAFAAIVGGVSDKIGRVNLVLGGILLIGLLQLVAIPNLSSKLAFAFAYSAIGIVEGVILVVTPALMRDFSPQVGRASAMGFWTLGPTLGSLVAALVATHTLSHLPPWQDQFMISGTVTLVVFVIAFVFLRELAPGLRSQLMVTQQERALIEARAPELDVAGAMRHPLRSVIRWDLISSSIGIALFLLIYYASVTVLTLYWVVVFNQTTSDANGINTWFWAFNAGTVVVIGIVSDALRVRKPFMLVGAVGAIVMTIVFLSRTSDPHTSYYTNVLISSLLGVMLGVAYPAWMAGFTEQVEARNPALAATGLAVWGWVLRIVVAISFVVLPYVITTATTLVDNEQAATNLQTFQSAQPYVPGTTNASPPTAPATVLTSLDKVGPPGEALASILRSYASTHSLGVALTSVPASLRSQVAGLLAFEPLAADIQADKTVTRAQIAAVGKSSPQLAGLLLAEQKVVPAQKAAPAEWRRWWSVCAGGQAVFLLLIFTMRGYWRPRSARRVIAEHQLLVQEEFAKIRGPDIAA